MIGSEVVSTFATSGGSASSGRLLSTRETRSRTSLAADSMSRSRPNSIVMRERSSWLLERSVSTPSRPATWFSMTCVIFVSTTDAEAPR